MVIFRLAVLAWAAFSATTLPVTGARAAEDKEAKVAPTGNPGAWFSSDDYPADARRANQQGRVSISLTVDPNGRAVKCDVVTSSGFPLLDSRTCEIAIRNARFTPARTASGKAITATYLIPGIRWQLTEPEPLDLSAGRKVLFRTVIESTVDSSGVVTGCKVIENAAAAPDPCADHIGTTAMQKLIKDGKPVSGTVTFTATATIDPIDPPPADRSALPER